MAMIQVGVEPCSIHAVAWGYNGDLNASFSFISLALNPDLKNLPKLDPKDQYLLGDSTTGSTLFVNNAASGSTASHAVPTVTWLRKTEYITSREGTNRPSSTADQCVPSSRRLECGW